MPRKLERVIFMLETSVGICSAGRARVAGRRPVLHGGECRGRGWTSSLPTCLPTSLLRSSDTYCMFCKGYMCQFTSTPLAGTHQIPPTRRLHSSSTGRGLQPSSDMHNVHALLQGSPSPTWWSHWKGVEDVRQLAQLWSQLRNDPRRQPRTLYAPDATEQDSATPPPPDPTIDNLTWLASWSDPPEGQLEQV